MTGGFDALLAATRAGDETAAAELFDRYQPRLLRFVSALEPRAADDLVGEVWLAVAKGISRFEGDEDGFRAWVFSIARRRVADHRRRGLRRRTDPMEPDQVLAALDGAREVEDDAARWLDDMSARDAVAALTRHLSRDQAEVLLLRILGDFSADEVATVLGRDATWVRVTQHRALRRLSRRLGSRTVVTE